MVLGHAVVPEGQHVRGPAYAALELQMGFDVPVEELEQGGAHGLLFISGACLGAAVVRAAEFPACLASVQSFSEQAARGSNVVR